MTEILSANRNGTVNSYIKDYHGNVAGKADASGRMIQDAYERMDYDAFGNQFNGDMPDPFGYCGEYYDNESGLIYLRNRYYDSRDGRFITEDPVKDGLNWYIYAGNNPVKFIDFGGLKKEDAQYKYRYYPCNDTVGPATSLPYYSNVNDYKKYSHTIQGVTDEGIRNGLEIYGHFNTLEIDTDGGKKQPGEDDSHSDETSFKYSGTGESLDAYSIHYVARANNYDGSANVRNGDIAVVIDHKNKTYVYAIVGDSGNTNVYNEVSVSTARDLGYPEAAWNCDAGRGDFVMIFFPGSGRDQWTNSGGQQQINEIGRKYFTAPSGYTGR